MIAADSDLDGAYNVGRGEEVSVLDLVEQLGMLGDELGLLNGRAFEPQFAPARAGRGAAQRARPDTLSRGARLRGRGRPRGRPAPHARMSVVARGRTPRAVTRPEVLDGELCTATAAGARPLRARDCPARRRVNASSGSICHGSSGRFRAQPAARVALAHADQLLDELAVEEQVAEQLAVRRALAAQQPVQQREVG